MDNLKLFNELLYSQNVKELTDILKKNNLWDDEKIWRYYGDIDNNVGQVHGQQSQPVKAFVEKITNSIDALLVLMCLKNGLDPQDWDNVPRTVSEAVEKFITNISRSLEELGQNEINSSVIGTMVMDGLKDLDPVAYVRFASVYRNFREEKDFVQFVDKIDVFKKR